MKPSRGFWIALASSVAVVGLSFGLYVWLSPCNGFKQSANMRAADKFIPTVQPRLLQEQRFADVTLESYTGGTCGCLLVRGSVASEDDLTSLKSIIAESQPSVEVRYAVTIGDEISPR